MGKVGAFYAGQIRRQLDAMESHEEKHSRNYVNFTVGPTMTWYKNAGKAKRERAVTLRDALVRGYLNSHPHSKIIFKEDPKTKNKLSKVYDEFHTLIGSVIIGGLRKQAEEGITEYSVRGVQINALSASYRQDGANLREEPTGFHIDGHALGRMAEREIAKDPIASLVEHMDTLNTFTALHIMLDAAAILRNKGNFDRTQYVMIPYGPHLLLGMTIVIEKGPNNGMSSFAVDINRRELKPQKPLDGIHLPNIKINTAVEFDMLRPEQDALNAMLKSFIVENGPSITRTFLSTFTTFPTVDSDDPLQDFEDIAARFDKQIRNTPEWKVVVAAATKII